MNGMPGFRKIVVGGFLLLLIGVLAGWLWRQSALPALPSSGLASESPRISSSRGGPDGDLDAGNNGKSQKKRAEDKGTQKRSLENVIAQITSGKLRPDEAGHINIDEAAELIRKTNLEVQDVNKRSRITSTVIGLLGAQGDAETAWSLIEPGAGSVRLSNLAAYFMIKSEPADRLVAKLSELTDPADYSSALNDLTSVRPQELSKMLADGTMVIEKGDMSSFLLGLIASTNQDEPLATDEARKVLENLSAMVSKGTMNADQFASVLAEGSFGNGFDQWQVIKGMDNFQAMAKSQASVIRNMMMVDPAQAMGEIMADDKAKASASVWNATMSSLYEMDTAYANRWVAENLSKLDAPTSQHVMASLARVALRDKDFATVEKWAGQVSDEKVRTNLLNELEKQRKKSQTANKK